MDLHNFLIVGWYLINVMLTANSSRAGYVEIKWWNGPLLCLVYGAFTVTMVLAGVAGSWQAIILFGWWIINIAYGVSHVGERTKVTPGTLFVAALGLIFFGYLGLTV